MATSNDDDSLVLNLGIDYDKDKFETVMGKLSKLYTELWRLQQMSSGSKLEKLGSMWNSALMGYNAFAEGVKGTMSVLNAVDKFFDHMAANMRIVAEQNAKLLSFRGIGAGTTIGEHYGNQLALDQNRAAKEAGVTAEAWEKALNTYNELAAKITQEGTLFDPDIYRVFTLFRVWGGYSGSGFASEMDIEDLASGRGTQSERERKLGDIYNALLQAYKILQKDSGASELQRDSAKQLVDLVSGMFGGELSELTSHYAIAYNDSVDMLKVFTGTLDPTVLKLLGDNARDASNNLAQMSENLDKYSRIVKDAITRAQEMFFDNSPVSTATNTYERGKNAFKQGLAIFLSGGEEQNTTGANVTIPDIAKYGKRGKDYTEEAFTSALLRGTKYGGKGAVEAGVALEAGERFLTPKTDQIVSRRVLDESGNPVLDENGHEVWEDKTRGSLITEDERRFETILSIYGRGFQNSADINARNNGVYASTMFANLLEGVYLWGSENKYVDKVWNAALRNTATRVKEGKVEANITTILDDLYNSFVTGLSKDDKASKLVEGKIDLTNSVNFASDLISKFLLPKLLTYTNDIQRGFESPGWSQSMLFGPLMGEFDTGSVFKSLTGIDVLNDTFSREGKSYNFLDIMSNLEEAAKDEGKFRKEMGMMNAPYLLDRNRDGKIDLDVALTTVGQQAADYRNKDVQVLLQYEEGFEQYFKSFGVDKGNFRSYSDMVSYYMRVASENKKDDPTLRRGQIVTVDGKAHVEVKLEYPTQPLSGEELHKKTLTQTILIPLDLHQSTK